MTSRRLADSYLARWGGSRWWATASPPATPCSRFGRWTAGGSNHSRSIYMPLAIDARRCDRKRAESAAAGHRLQATGNARGEKHCFHHARSVGDATARDVERRTVIGRTPRKRQSEGDVHRVSKRGHLDGGHPDIVIRRDHGVERPTHRPNEDRVRREGTLETSVVGRGCEQLVVFTTESAAVAGGRIHRAERDARLGACGPSAQSRTP